MMGLPPPTSFAEGQRKLFGLLAAGAGMFCGLMSIGMICLLMWGRWAKSEEHTIVVIFGWSLGGFIVAMCAVIIGLMVGGPVGRFKAGVSKDGATFEADNGGASPGPVVTTTTTTVPVIPPVQPPPAPPPPPQM